MGLSNLRQYVDYLRTPLAQRRLLVYSEGAGSWPHLGPVVQALLDRGDQPLSYVSSSAADPGIAIRHPQLRGFVIGDRLTRTLFFSNLKADVVLMTMPDLNTFHIKRSPQVGNYVYLHHSLVSSHMIYRPGAFDHFDTIFCAGPHHVAEMRAIETQRGQRQKVLVEHGYGRLDTLLSTASTLAPGKVRPTVLIAPSWGPQGLLERHADQLLSALADTAWNVIVRPHPQTVRMAPEAMAQIRHWCAMSGNISLELSVVGHDSLQRADVMVSDWSGAALEFAFGFQRPVLFIDTPRKINNPDYEQIDLLPLEVGLRQQIGQVLPPDSLSDITTWLGALNEQRHAYRETIAQARTHSVYHLGSSGPVAAEWLFGQLKKKPAG